MYPGATSSLGDIMVNFFVYDSLVTSVDGVIKPMLAKTWNISEDKKEYIFNLRDDVYFHSGRKFTAKDCKAHFDNMKNMTCRKRVAAVEKTEVVDDYTFKVTLKYPTLTFINYINHTEWTFAGIPDSVAVEKYGKDYGLLPQSISGTGPFMVKKWLRGDRIEFERFDKYKWGAAPYENQGPAKLDKVTVRSIPEGSSRTSELLTGGIDINCDLVPSDIKTIKEAKGISLYSAPKITANRFGFNLDRALFKDKNVRVALAHCVNQQNIVKYIQEGYGDIAYGLWSKGIEGHTPDQEMKKKYFYDFDLDAAAKIFDENGWGKAKDGIRAKDGEKIEFSALCYAETDERILQLIQADMRKVGVKMNVERLEYAARTAKLKAGKHDTFHYNGTHTTADHGSIFTTAALPYPNINHLSDPEIDRLFDITQKATVSSEREKAFQDLDKRMVSEAYIVPLPRTRWLVGINDRVKGLVFNPVQGIYKLLDTYIEE